jgi:excinuclease UvrABC nuclease subunit
VRAAAGRKDDKEMDRDEMLEAMHADMLHAAEEMEFETAAKLRDRINRLKAAPRVEGMILPEEEPTQKRSTNAGMPGTRASGKRIHP